MLATKHFDVVLGVDLHIVMLMTPAGPVPTPMPIPFTGIVFNPRDYLPVLGVNVKINGLPRATAGAKVIALPMHVPIGGPFLRPPPNAGELFMGSCSVASGGEPLAYGALPVLTCQDIGVPPPARAKGGKSRWAPLSMVLPTSLVIPIPAQRNVLIGGFPTVSLKQLENLAKKPGNEKLWAPFKKLKPLKALRTKQKRRARILKLHADRVLKKLGLDKITLLRNEVHRAICTVTGHPVDIATGKVFTDHVDLTLRGPLPFSLERVWFSTSTYDGPLGHGWHGSFDVALAAAGEVVAVRLSDGRAALFPALSSGTSHFDPAERLTLARDVEGYVLTEASTGLVRRFARVAGRDDLPMIALRDRSGFTVSFRHDAHGRLARILDAGGRRWDLHYHGRTHRIGVVEGPHPEDCSARLVYLRYRYDACGNLVEARDALGHAQRFAYRDHLLVHETRPGGLSFRFTWEGTGGEARCVRTFGDGGLFDHALSYDLERRTTIVENSLGQRASYVHDGAMVTRVVDALGYTRSTAYDEGHRPRVERDPLGRRTERTYDARGNLTVWTRADGSAVSFAYDAHDLPVRAVDACGGSWRWTHDAQGRLVAETDPLDRTTTYVYEGAFLTAVVDPSGARTTYGYDEAGNLTQRTAPSGATTRFAYDRLGRWIATTDARGATLRRELDLLARPVRVHEPDGNVRTLTYDAEGNIVRSEDAHRDVRFAYTGLGCLTARHEAGTSLQLRYDSEQQLTDIVDAHGSRHRISRDARGDVVAEHGFDGVIRRYARDAAGRVVHVQQPSGRATTYAYDACDRVVEVRHDDQSWERYAYRADGALQQARNADATVYFAYDAVGRLVREARDGHWVESAYDARDARIGVCSSGGLALANAEDDMSYVTGVKEAGSGFAVRFTRDALGDELSRSLPGGLHARIERDASGRPTRHAIRYPGALLHAASYAWQPDARLCERVEGLTGATAYRHDARGRLVRARQHAGAEALRLCDALGNPFRSEAHDDRTYGPDGRLLRACDVDGETQRAYDAEGRLVQKVEPSGATWHYAWSAAGTLSEVVRPDGSTVHFTYDALGRRIQKRYRGRTQHFMWDGDVVLHEWTVGVRDALSAAGGVPFVFGSAAARRREAQRASLLERDAQRPTTWIFEPDRAAPLARIEGDAHQSVVCDYLGTPMLVGRDGGEPGCLLALDIAGNVHSHQGDLACCPWRWPGQYADPETGLHYNRFRYYDPEAAGYVSPDPIGLWGGLRAYAYVDDPLAWIDPLGLRACASGPTAGPAVPHDTVRPGVAPVLATSAAVSRGHAPTTRAHEHARDHGAAAWVRAQVPNARDDAYAPPVAGPRRSGPPVMP